MFKRKNYFALGAVVLVNASDPLWELLPVKALACPSSAIVSVAAGIVSV